MFINLSNHPSMSWGVIQRTTAQRFGEIVDISFPEIDPLYDTEKVMELAYEYHDKCRSMLGQTFVQSAVHLAGEPVFCFLLAQLLLKDGVICLTSTTKRIVTEENGIKKSQFEFIRFREYKLVT